LKKIRRDSAIASSEIERRKEKIFSSGALLRANGGAIPAEKWVRAPFVREKERS
jgi:hypothetical protein